MRRRAQSGFTLIELVLALTIVAIMVTMLFSGLRVGLRAWQTGEERANALQHSRSMTQILEGTLSGTYWYLALLDKTANTPVLLFKGEADRVSFVTGSPPMPIVGLTPFVAVTMSIDQGNNPGFAIRQKAMPNFDPFEAITPIVVDPTVSAIQFRYMRDGGSWEDTWNAVDERALPQAIEVTLRTTVSGREEQLPPFVVPIRVNAQ
ncbi:MAG TPA: prepilin-type N-terminal cleavage/methylation domain-containing protein [Candidatus Methylomirabilis sp.]|nr:prepilin-type N-terminal cleavage/methylation domain-containing protein [Candidatus Methylomirabilis sp.]